MYLCSMKKIITILLFFISSILFSQKKTDSIIYDKFNYDLFNELLLEEVNTQRHILNIKPYNKCNISKKASDYQVQYMKYYSTPCHYNDKKFRGVILGTPKSRVDYFNEKKKPHIFYSDEVCLQSKTSIRLATSHPNTYEGLAKSVISKFMSSKCHKIALLSDYPTIPIKNRTAGFSTSINITENNMVLYVAGVIVDEY